MITPRTTRLIRVPDLRTFQRAIATTACDGRVRQVRARVVIVPTRAAAAQLRRTIEGLLLGPSGPGSVSAVALPHLSTRDDWYRLMRERLLDPPDVLSEPEREVMLAAAAREAKASGAAPPFELRPGLVAEMLALYDALRRLGRNVEAFERLIESDLEPLVDSDRGADRLLRQTRFLAAAFRGYEERVARCDWMDEHALRDRLLLEPAVDPLRHVLVTVADQASDVMGLWPADFDLLARLPLLERVDVVATERQLASGLHARLRDLLPGMAEERLDGEDAATPLLEVPAPGGGSLAFVRRDREDELAEVARALKRRHRSDAATPLDRAAIVFRRPLPYVYLARQIFASARIPFQVFDALPLASEPYAAALDLVLDFVTSGCSRAATAALLGSPLFRFEAAGARVSARDAAALDHAARKERILGGSDWLERWVGRLDPKGGAGDAGLGVARAAAAAAQAALALEPLGRPAPPSMHLSILVAFLVAHGVPPSGADAVGEREVRARAAILGALQALETAHRQFDDAPRPFEDLVPAIRRWIEAQTFTPRAGPGGVQMVDAHAAPYGDFDEMFVVGLVGEEWPERARQNVFYPQSLLSGLGWRRDADRRAAARAAFLDLILLPRTRVTLSTFTLEDDAPVGPSGYLEDVCEAGLRWAPEESARRARIFRHEAMAEAPIAPTALDDRARAWLSLRLARSPSSDDRFHGQAGSPRPRGYAVTAVERYLECPFKYFARDVLEIAQPPEDEEAMGPRERGVLAHRVIRRFFDEWKRAGGGAVRPDNLDQALERFEAVVDDELARLPATERLVERMLLVGSAGGVGMGERLLRFEAERDTPVIERLLEYRLEGDFELLGDGGARVVRLHGQADRIDLLADGTFRVIDYKTGQAPARGVSLQLAVYGACTSQRLDGYRGRSWRLGEAGYLAFGVSRTFVPIVARGSTIDQSVADGQRRFLGAVDGIERGEFPPRPVRPHLCPRCAYESVCRKDYVRDDA